jgi:hypothetical protein
MRSTPRNFRPGRGRWPALSLTVAGVFACAAAACGPAPVTSSTTPARAGLDDSGYFGVADRLQTRLDRFWNEREGRYEPRAGEVDTEVNADLLLAHSVAALRGHQGASRNDRRARLVARWLVDGEVWAETPRPGAGADAHGPSFVSTPEGAGQHMVFNAEAVDGLVHAYLARRALHLPHRTVALIKDRIRRLARSQDWRWPALRLNQFNWYVEIFAATAVVNGERSVLARGMRRHLARFAAGARPHGRAAGNFGAGMHFHYLPDSPAGHQMNVDSAEYANIVLSATRYYGQARQAGMPRPPASQRRLFHGWIRRAIAGYWTHSGYLNWDSGLGFERWHQAKKLGLAQQALIGIARSGDLAPSPAWRAYAKWLLDRSLTWYDGMATREGAIPPAVLFDVSAVPLTGGNADLAAARVESNAARAVAAGLGTTVAATAPPALYAYDPDIGRLAVTTPRYNTAIIAASQHAFPYGGIELARLYDGEQNVAANIGGRSPAAFGVIARGPNGRALLASQAGGSAPSRRVPRLRLTRAPSGVGASATTRRALAGAFTELEAVGHLEQGGAGVTSRYRFTPASIEGRWAVTGRGVGRVDVTFPSWGRGASVVAALCDGRRVTLGGARIALADVRSLHVISERGGYTVEPLVRPRGAVVGLVGTTPQSSAPSAGPSLVVALRRAGARTAFGARITVDPAVR